MEQNGAQIAARQSRHDYRNRTLHLSIHETVQGGYVAVGLEIEVRRKAVGKRVLTETYAHDLAFPFVGDDIAATAAAAVELWMRTIDGKETGGT